MQKHSLRKKEYEYLNGVSEKTVVFYSWVVILSGGKTLVRRWVKKKDAE